MRGDRSIDSSCESNPVLAPSQLPALLPVTRLCVALSNFALVSEQLRFLRSESPCGVERKAIRADLVNAEDARAGKECHDIDPDRRHVAIFVRDHSGSECRAARPATTRCREADQLRNYPLPRGTDKNGIPRCNDARKL